MDPVPIGQAARQLGINPSALRYYDQRGLLRPAARRGGRRLYGSDELRRLAFIHIVQRLGISLDTAAAILDAPSDQWRETVRDQIAALEQQIAWARGAQQFLTHALHCPVEHPARECPDMIQTLDRLVAGMTFEQLAAEHTDRPPKPSSRQGARPRRPSGRSRPSGTSSTPDARDQQATGAPTSTSVGS
jgi:DNA-binding transcriptional MerR regulator